MGWFLSAKCDPIVQLAIVYSLQQTILKMACLHEVKNSFVLFQKCWVLVTLALLVGEMVTAQDGSQSPVQVEDHKPAATEIHQKEKDAMPYIETSQFRRNFPPNNLVIIKPSTDTTKKEIPTVKKQMKLKNPFVQLSEKKSFKEAQEAKLAVTTSKKEDKHETIILDPPAPYQLPFNDEIFLSFRALPSNEEYDRNSNYQHSFLYGYERF